MLFYMWKIVPGRRLVKKKKRKREPKRENPLTEREKAEIVVQKIINGVKTTPEDQQIFVNNSAYIEQRLQEIAEDKS